jgi:multiple sugar transport system permease protein
MSSAATGTIGGPLNSTDVVLTYMWKQAFAEIDLGYGAALSFLLAAAIVAVSLVEFRLLRRQDAA